MGKGLPGGSEEGSGEGGAFCFDPDAPLVRFSERQIVAGLRRYVDVHGPGPFTTKQFDAWADRPFGHLVVTKRLGSWRRALALVGVHGARGMNYGAEELAANLERLWRELGRRPGKLSLERDGHIGVAPYKRVWGSVERACRLLAAHHRGELTREELLRAGPGKQRRENVRAALRWRILKRDGHRCVACGRGPATHPGLVLEVDHITPVSRGGGNEEANLRTLCRACNGGRGNRG